MGQPSHFRVQFSMYTQSAFILCLALKIKTDNYANSVDPDEAVTSGSALFAILFLNMTCIPYLLV